MNKFKAISTLIRLPNLFFILLTQVLVYLCLILPVIESPTLSYLLWSAFALSTVLIATAGYIINDYFDIGIDAVNKPEKVTIEKIFKRRTIILWHIVLNLIALLISGYIAFAFVKFRFVGLQLFSVFLLLIYSTTFKRKLIVGNISIAILTSFTLITTALYEPKFQVWNYDQPRAKLLWVYIIFAFIITLIREMIKDIEDIKGDSVLKCSTIPLVWGIDRAKQIVFGLHMVMFLFLAIVGVYFFTDNKILISYLFISVFVPLIWNLKKIKEAKTSSDFHKLSSAVKWITLMGILSMLLVNL
jgi:4-hydroxybenzoate polyprenyltransferase